MIDIYSSRVCMLGDNIIASWAVPLGGFGHAADEQPMPYIRSSGRSLTPRFGGDESLESAGYLSLPLPHGKLSSSWPFQQRCFNLTRRKMNIYWRNLFTSFCRQDRMFLFAEQLSFSPLDNGFEGLCPLLYFRRTFTFGEGYIRVVDYTRFHRFLCFEYFNDALIALLPENQDKLSINVDQELNQSKQISSSTGLAHMHFRQLKHCNFQPMDELHVNYEYRILK